VKAPNPIDVVELAYQLEGSDQDWLTNVMAAVRPLLEGGAGIVAYHYDIRTSHREWIAGAVSLDLTRQQIDVVAKMLEVYEPADVNAIQVMPEPLGTLSEGSVQSGIPNPLDRADIRSYMATIGASDSVALRTIEPSGKGIVFCGFQRATRTYERRTKALWAKVSAHLAAGRRLREAARPVEVVLTPGGKVEHAEGEAKERPVREVLREAVVRQEKARGLVRREDPEAATEMWTALVAGRWSLVDQFERGGRRYVVARRNEQGCTALGKSNKLIAYELGLSPSTVGSHLSSAMRKLGVASRIELMKALFAPR